MRAPRGHDARMIVPLANVDTRGLPGTPGHYELSVVDVYAADCVASSSASGGFIPYS